MFTRLKIINRTFNKNFIYKTSSDNPLQLLNPAASPDQLGGAYGAAGYSETGKKSLAGMPQSPIIDTVKETGTFLLGVPGKIINGVRTGIGNTVGGVLGLTETIIEKPLNLTKDLSEKTIKIAAAPVQFTINKTRQAVALVHGVMGGVMLGIEGIARKTGDISSNILQKVQTVVPEIIKKPITISQNIINGIFRKITDVISGKPVYDQFKENTPK